MLSSILLIECALGQTGIPYCWNCPANDLVITETWLGDASGNRLATCIPGSTTPVHAYLWAKFEPSTNAQRNGIVLYVKVTRDGLPIIDTFEEGGKCINNVLPEYMSGGTEYCEDAYSCVAGDLLLSLVDFDYICGQEIKIEDIYVGWESKGVHCTDCVCPTDPYQCQHSKCYHGANIIVPGNQPLISILKYANPEYVVSGGSVTYTYYVSNTGNTALYDVDLEDNTGLIPIRGTDIVGNGDIILDTGEIWEYSVTSNPTADITNIGTVTAHSSSNTYVTDSDDATVRIISLDITKTAMPDKGCPETPIDFTITLSSGFPITAATITDILPIGLTYVSSDPAGTVDPLNDHKIDWNMNNPTLPWIIALKAYMDGAAFGLKTNVVTATGTIYGNSITKSASSAVNILEDPEAIITQVSPPP
jgi:hypothetical protein